MSEQATIQTNDLPWKLVVHQRPDTDALACLWGARRFVVPAGTEPYICFVEAGSTLPPEDCEGFNVLYMDVGGGPCDQHGKGLARASSFQLLAREYGFANDPGIRHILELTVASDNVERLNPLNMHYYFKGLPHLLRDPATQEIDWAGVVDRAFEVLDVFYGMHLSQANSRKEWLDKGRAKRLGNGVQIGSIWWNPGLREAAFEEGMDVVMWTNSRSKKRMEVGIQVGRNSPVTLEQVAFMLRKAEAAKRGIELSDEQAAAIGECMEVPTWFLHDSKRLILSGSRSKRLLPEECTLLEAIEIRDILVATLEKLPRRSR
ncbi:MAG: hypothetical protein JWO84_780 [Parcubacteria group bacterium]|nr:hypothetical protein [Parcubacteria group bacterium]